MNSLPKISKLPKRVVENSREVSGGRVVIPKVFARQFGCCGRRA